MYNLRRMPLRLTLEEPGWCWNDALSGVDVHKLAGLTLRAVDRGKHVVLSCGEVTFVDPNFLTDDDDRRKGHVCRPGNSTARYAPEFPATTTSIFYDTKRNLQTSNHATFL